MVWNVALQATFVSMSAIRAPMTTRNERKCRGANETLKTIMKLWFTVSHVTQNRNESPFLPYINNIYDVLLNCRCKTAHMSTKCVNYSVFFRLFECFECNLKRFWVFTLYEERKRMNRLKMNIKLILCHRFQFQRCSFWSEKVGIGRVMMVVN